MWSSAVVVQAFAPPSSSALSSSSIAVTTRREHLVHPTSLASTLDKTKTSSSTTTSVPPERIAPEAGYIPPFENRYNPITLSEFMISDNSAHDAGETMYECPLTLRNSENINIIDAQRLAASTISQNGSCPYEIYATTTDNEMGIQYFITNKDKIRANLLQYGAIWFRNFHLMKTVKGNRNMYEALGLQPCLDPLHSSGLRKFASERDALYEEVSGVSYKRKILGLNICASHFNSLNLHH
jgi:hypothetical protein